MTCLTYHEFLKSFMPVKFMLLDRLSFLPIVQNLILLWLSSSRNGFRCSGQSWMEKLLRVAVVVVIISQNLTLGFYIIRHYRRRPLCVLSVITLGIYHGLIVCGIALSRRDNYRWFVLGAGAKRYRRRGTRRRGRRHTTWTPSPVTQAHRTPRRHGNYNGASGCSIRYYYIIAPSSYDHTPPFARDCQ